MVFESYQASAILFLTLLRYKYCLHKSHKSVWKYVLILVAAETNKQKVVGQNAFQIYNCWTNIHDPRA